MYWTISREVNKEDIAWLAGVWDGEGCLRASFERNKLNSRPTLSVTTFVKNTDVLMIQKVSEILYQHGIKFSIYIQKGRVDANRASHKKILCLRVYGKGNVWKLLTLMLPYLTTKKKQACLMLELITYRESLGYHGLAKPVGRKPGQWNGVEITDDPKIVGLVERIQAEKNNLIDPSETKRVANRPLRIPKKVLEAYLMRESELTGNRKSSQK